MSNKVANSNSEPPIYGDILDTILSHLPLIHLVPASFVSKSWSHAVYSSSIATSTNPKPWLFIYTQAQHFPHKITTHAFDPATNIWINIKQPMFNNINFLPSTNSNFIYTLCESKLSFSFDPLHLTWHHASAPVDWIDPIVALVGDQVVVAGSAYGFDHDPLAVEIYDISTCKWTACEPMPASLMRNSESFTWLSAAVNDNKLYLTEKESSQGVTYDLDVEARVWNGPYNLLPDPIIFNSVTGFVNGWLILIGLILDVHGSSNIVKVWEVNCETFEREIIGEMPDELVKKLKGEEFKISSIEVRMAGKFAYIYNPAGVDEVITCEFVDGGCMWGSVRNKVKKEGSFMDCFTLACSEVGMKDLQKAMQSGNVSFKVKL